MIRPTVRTKRRYIGFKIIGKDADKVDRRTVNHAFRSTLLQLYGEVGSSIAGYKLIHYSAEEHIGIVRFERKFILEGIAMFAFIKALKASGAVFDARPVPILTSGTVKRLKIKLGIKTL